MIQGLIFDFDGLILETEGPIYQSWQELYETYQCDFSFEVWAKAIGRAEDFFDPFANLEKLAGKPLDRETLAPRRRLREQELILAQPVLPGVLDYLDSASRLGLKLGVASSSSRLWVNGHLERLGLLEYFDCIKCSDDVSHPKPDPELYQSALDCLGLEASQAIALEDSPNGILSAKQAGLYCVAVPNELTRRLPLDQADLRLESLTAYPLERLLENLNNHHR